MQQLYCWMCKLQEEKSRYDLLNIFVKNLLLLNTLYIYPINNLIANWHQIRSKLDGKFDVICQYLK